jgi:cytochrome c
VAVIRLLLDAGAELDPVAENETPFLHAIKWSHFRAAKALLERGAKVDFQDRSGMTALHYMLKKRSDERNVRMVLKFGARGDLPDSSGSTVKEIMMRKRSVALREMAAKLEAG